jgi:hypothetical protein
MITIKILNAKEILEQESHWLIAKFAHHFIDIQTKVEKEIARQIEDSLSEKNIQSTISVVREK